MTVSRYFSKSWKLRLALCIIRVLLVPECAASKMSATMLRKSRFLLNKTTYKVN